jgi:carbonic anhydrase
MRSTAKKLLVAVALVASTACKHPETDEAETTSGESAKDGHGEKGEEKEEKPEKGGKPEKRDKREKRGAKEHGKSDETEHDDADKEKGHPREPKEKEDSKLAGHEKKGHGEAEPKDEPKKEEGGGKKEYDVPFIEGHRDPLALTRGFFKEVMADNAKYMQKHDASFFRDFAFAQTPRATVITCSDSRVQSSAFDSTAENDDFTIRNIGNQVGNSEGSVEYGVHHLHTPVLFVLGHTGCGAVKAAMGDYSKESEAITHELQSLHVPGRKDGVKDDDPRAWLDAVVDNVNDQVTVALGKFDDELSRGVLTVVGAVYDFRNDFKLGAGKVVIVNVNGVTDQAKLKQFTKSLGGSLSEETAPPKPGVGKDAPALTSLGELRQALAHIPAHGAAAEVAHVHETKEPAKEPGGHAEGKKED